MYPVCVLVSVVVLCTVFFFFLRCMFRIIGNSQLDGQWSKCRNGHCEIDKTTFYAQTRYYTRLFISRSRRVCEYSERATASGARYARVVAFVWIGQHFVILSFVGFWFLVGMTFRLFITFWRTVVFKIPWAKRGKRSVKEKIMKSYIIMKEIV